MSLNRRRFMLGCAAVASLPTATVVRAAEPWPSRQVEIIVPYASGGGTDAIARLFANAMTADLGVPVIVVNRPGARSIPAYQAVIAAPANGGTLLFDNSSHTLQSLFKLSYDVERDLAPISLAAVASSVLLVSNNLGVDTYQQFIAKAKAAPGSITCGSYGIGTISHLQEEVLSQAAGIQLQHIPYKGSAPALNDLVGGHVQALFADAVAALPLVKAGKIKAIAAIGDARVPNYPDTPTFGELGIRELSAPGWWGFFARQGTPPDLIVRLVSAIARAADSADVKRTLADLGAVPKASDPAAFGAIIRTDVARWKGIVTARNIALD